MRNWNLPAFALAALLGPCCALNVTAGHGDGTVGAPLFGDTMTNRAIALLKENLEHLRNIRSEQQQFILGFLNPDSKHPCDVCPDLSPKPVASYAATVFENYPNGFAFTYEIDEKAIDFRQSDEGQRVYWIPYTKRIEARNANTPKDQRTFLDAPRTVHLKAEIVVDHVQKSFGIREVVLESSPSGNTLMVELSPLFGLGSLKFDDIAGFEPKVADSYYQLGVVYYFNPFSAVNAGNVWLKTGLRAGLRSTRLELDGLEYSEQGLALREAQGLDITVPEVIDVRRTVNNITERTQAITLQIPLGISKRWQVGRGLEFAIEAEVAYALVLSRKVRGSYDMDQLGTKHLLTIDTIGDMMDNSSQSPPLVYASSPAAVVSGKGERIDFFTGRTSLLDDLETKKGGMFSFGFNPSVFIRRNNEIKYNIGLRFQWMSNPRTDAPALDASYFANEEDTSRPPLTSMTSSAFQTFIGLTLGLKL